MTGKAGANRSTNSRNLVFGLKCPHAETLVTRQFVQDVRRGRNRIRSIKQRTTRDLRGRNKSDGSRFVAGDLPILAGSDLRFLDCVVSGENFGGVGKVITGLQR